MCLKTIVGIYGQIMEHILHLQKKFGNQKGDFMSGTHNIHILNCIYTSTSLPPEKPDYLNNLHVSAFPFQRNRGVIL